MYVDPKSLQNWRCDEIEWLGKTFFLHKMLFRSSIKTVLIRKAVAVGEIGRGPGDRASGVIELGRLVEVELGLNTKGILKKFQFSINISNLEHR